MPISTIVTNILDIIDRIIEIPMRENKNNKIAEKI